MKKLLLFLLSLPIYAQLISPSAAVRMGAVPSSCIAGSSNAILVNNAGTDEILTCDNTGHYTLPPGGSTSVLTGDADGAAGSNKVINLSSDAVYLNNNTAIGINQAGATAGAKIAAAIAALPSTGGTIDAAGILGGTISSNIFTGITKPITIVLGAGNWVISSALTIPINVTLTGVIGTSLDFTAAVTINAQIAVPGGVQFFANPLTVVPTIGPQADGAFFGWFGTDNTGTNDSTTAVASARTALATTGGNIRFGPGTFKITSTVLFAQNINVLGSQGNSTLINCIGSTLQCFAMASLYQNYTNELKGGFRDLSISCNASTGGTSTGLYLGGDSFGVISPSTYGYYGGVISNVNIYGCNTGIAIGKNMFLPIIEGASLKFNAVGIRQLAGAANSGELLRVNRSVFNGNTVGISTPGGSNFQWVFGQDAWDDNTTAAIQATGQLLAEFNECHFEQIGSGGTSSFINISTNGSKMTFTGNTFNTDPVTGPSPVYLVHIGAPNSNRVTFKGGVISANYTIAEAVRIEGTDTTSSVSVENTNLPVNLTTFSTTPNLQVSQSGTYTTKNLILSLGGKATCTHGTNGTCITATLSSGIGTFAYTPTLTLATSGGAGDDIDCHYLTGGTAGWLAAPAITSGTGFTVTAYSAPATVAISDSSSIVSCVINHIN